VSADGFQAGAGGARRSALILGIGNILWADEGFGVRCAEALHAGCLLPPGVEVMDGGTQGLNLVGDICAADRLLVFDAVDWGASPGTLIRARDEEIHHIMGAGKMSLHQAGFSDVLACADLLGQAPVQVTLIGIQPVELEDYGGSLTAPVAAAVPQAVAMAVAELARWGITLEPRQGGDVPESLITTGLEAHRYEAERPSADRACRFGDERVLAQLEGA